MRNNNFYLFSLIALAIGGVFNHARAVTPASVATVPDGMIAFSLTSGVVTYLSLPLTSHPTYTSVVSAVTTNTVSVDDTPAPFTQALATASSPYFIKFLSGNELGRVMLVTANTTSTLTVDTTDHASGAAVALTATGFNVQAGDTFEVFPGDTIASVFGSGTAADPLLLVGASSITTADVVDIFTTVGVTAKSYFFNTAAGCWQLYGSTANANNTIIYPYSAFGAYRRTGHATTTLVLAGRVTQVAASTKVVGLTSVYTSTHYATTMKLSQLKFSSNWLTGTSALLADTISVWNATTRTFDTFFQKPDSTWHNSVSPAADQSNYVIAAGAVTTIAKKQLASGAGAFLQSSLPYSLK